MTDQLYDDRAAAYIGARDRLKAAEQVKAALHKAHPRELDKIEFPDLYWSNIAEAAILSNLARADSPVGYAAGNYFAELDRRAERRERAKQGRELIDRIARGPRRQAHRKAEPPFEQGHRVRIVGGDCDGHTGTVLLVDRDNEPPVADVGLDVGPTITVPLDDLEVDATGAVDVLLLGAHGDETTLTVEREWIDDTLEPA
jgi:hypothetical protein